MKLYKMQIRFPSGMVIDREIPATDYNAAYRIARDLARDDNHGLPDSEHGAFTIEEVEEPLNTPATKGAAQ